MSNEGEPQFELPLQPSSSERPADQTDGAVIERQSPAAQEAGVAKRAPQPGSTAAPDVPDLSGVPALPSVPADDTQADEPVYHATADLKADDSDLIEKEWITRAKSIVSQTHDDPHRQKEEMSRVKADYIKKRFNKIIKTDETAPA